MKFNKQILLITLVLGGCVGLGGEPVFQTAEGPIRGYDPVAYFTEGKPVKGSEQFSYRHGDVTWLLSSPAQQNVVCTGPGKVHSPVRWLLRLRHVAWVCSSH